MMSMRWTVVFIVIALVAVGAWFIFNRGGLQVSMPSLSIAGGGGAAARNIPSGFKEFRSERYRFSLLYPEDLRVAERDEGGGAATITFENTDEAKGFQLFIVPYFAPQISEARFLQDIPSGVREREKAATIGGVQASTFYSRSDALGDTFEIWFLHGELLYEATTLAPLDSWLSDIMQNWQFIQ